MTLFCKPLFLIGTLPVSLLTYYAAPASDKAGILISISCLLYAAEEARFLRWLTALVLLNDGVARGLQTCPAAYRTPLPWAGFTRHCAFFVVLEYSDFLFFDLNTIA